MEAVKTILDFQASLLTLVSPRGVFGAGGGVSICVTMANRVHTPPHTASRRKRH